VREVAAITRQFEHETQELRAELNASRIEHDATLGGSESIGEEEGSERSNSDEEVIGKVGLHYEATDSDNEVDLGCCACDFPDDGSQRSLV